MLYVFLGLILAFILWNASMKMLLILILLLVLFIAFYTTPLNRVFDVFENKEDDDEREEFETNNYVRTPTKPSPNAFSRTQSSNSESKGVESPPTNPATEKSFAY